MVGGSGERYLLRVVAQHADWWNYNFRGREDYLRKQEVLKHHCREVGREYAAIQHVVRVGILLAETEREVERLKAQPHVRPAEAGDLVGTPARVTETLLQAIAAGAHSSGIGCLRIPASLCDRSSVACIANTVWREWRREPVLFIAHHTDGGIICREIDS
jgi:alkanesulfonate monooxygenase SsuD/methylene tetrahydromethanopterin reductase-like flavin-dependent oxidoreductase (luciferase family)